MTENRKPLSIEYSLDLGETFDKMRASLERVAPHFSRQVFAATDAAAALLHFASIPMPIIETAWMPRGTIAMFSPPPPLADPALEAQARELARTSLLSYAEAQQAVMFTGIGGSLLEWVAEHGRQLIDELSAGLRSRLPPAARGGRRRHRRELKRRRR